MPILGYLFTLLLRFGIFTMELIPLKGMYFLADIVGTFITWLSPKNCRLIRDNVKIAYPDGAPFSEKDFPNKVFRHFIRTFVELFLAKKICDQDMWDKHITGPGLDVVQRLPKEGAIICSAHVGSIFILNHLLNHLGYKLILVVRKLNNQYLHDFFDKLLGRASTKIVVKSEAYEIFKQELPKKKDCPVIVMDQYAGQKALLVEFMGCPAYTAASAAALSRQFQVPIFIFILFRLKNGNFEFHAEQIPPMEATENKQEDLNKITMCINQALTKYIRMHPEQWFWMHRRWR